LICYVFLCGANRYRTDLTDIANVHRLALVHVTPSYGVGTT